MKKQNGELMEKIIRWNSIFVFGLIYILIASASAAAGVIVSDDFNSPVIKTPLWTIIDPLNDSAFTIAGAGTKNALLSIYVNDSTQHEFTNDNYNAPRIMQDASNTDFEVEVKFQSQMTSMNQMEGVIIQQDSNRSIKFNFERGLFDTYINAVTFDNDSYAVMATTSISGSPSLLYMRVKRTGDNWTMKYSSDNITWDVLPTFPYVLTVTSVGPFAGQTGAAWMSLPAYTCLVDYFFNVDSPIVPEDLSKFNISGFKFNASDGTRIANWNVTLTNDTVNVSKSTDFNGFYEFTDIIEGTYTVSEEMRAGWTNVTEISRQITGIDQNILVNFSNMPIIPTYTISGYKINASDNSGISGWNITITNGTLTTSTLTDDTGFYSFPNLLNDTYTISEDLRSSDWTNITPATLDITIFGQDEQVNFTNLPIIPTYSVSGFKINGSDGSGLPGWNITITNGTVTKSTLTDDTGFYNFSNLVNDTYTISEELQPDWKNVTPVSRGIRVSGHDEQNVNFTNIPLVIISDDFSDSTLNLSIWTIINPKNDTSFNMVGTGTRDALLSIPVPGTADHDLWTNANYAPRIMQNASNKDFEIEVKFQSRMNKSVQMQGVIIQQDNLKFIRFDFTSDGSNTYLFAATFTNGAGTSKGFIGIGNTSLVDMYMRVKRSGDIWTTKYSLDGITWTPGYNFPFSMNVTSVGPFVGNKGPSTGYTGLIDYFFNNNSRIVPEDESKYSISGFKINGSDGTGIPNWNITVKNNAVQASTTTNNTGFYEFPYLLNGTYTVSEELKPEWINITPLSRQVNISGEGVPNVNFTNKPLVIVSDDFNAPTIKTPLWTKIDPLSDSAFAVVGSGTKNATLSIYVNGSTQHDFRPGYYNAPRIMQNASNRDFEIEVKFQSQMTSMNQMEGVIIQQDSTRSIRFNFERGLLDTNIKAVTFDHESSVVMATGSISGSPDSLYMRLKRAGDDWTMIYSSDGITWDSLPTFQSVLTVTSVGPFAGQSGLPYITPEYTCLVDYFFNRESPIVPEDVSKFKLSGYKLNASDGIGIANWNITVTNSTMNAIKSTDSNGFYEFTDLVEGNYTLSEEMRPGWKNVTTISRSITGTDQNILVNFRNRPIIPAYNVSGFKINASDGMGIPGWNITITNGTLTTSISTDSEGFYEFIEIQNGTYTVSEELRPEWNNVTQTSQTVTVLGHDQFNVNFTNKPVIHTYTVSGFKINAIDNTRLSGWNITIKNTTMQISKLTDSNGFYNFSDLINGTYTIFEEMQPDWKNVTLIHREIEITGNDITDLNFTNKPLDIVSDDFSKPELNTSIWTFINPKNDAIIAISGNGTKNALLSIAIPASTGTHNIWDFENNAPKLMQNASNKDFEIEIKFQSRMNKSYQMQGVIIQQDNLKFIRFDFESDGYNNTNIFAATFNNSIGTGLPLIRIGGTPSADPLYMRVKRSGDNWTMNYSSDGSNWIQGFTFQYVLKVTSVGLFVGNDGLPAPAHTGLVDYFFNKESPIVPEDAPPAGTKFNVSGFKINASDGTGIRNWNITITDGTNTTSSLTDIDGFYKFSNISQGTYTVTEEMQPGWGNVTARSREITVQYENISGLNFTNTPLSIASDDFSSPVLNTSLWTKIDPLNDSNFIIEGIRTSDALLNITIPEGKSHDPLSNGINNASRIVQSVRNMDFEVEVKFQSLINRDIQMQGILVEQDKKNYTRFEFYSYGNKIYVYKADIINGILRNGIGIPTINASDSPMPMYMKVKREGNHWTQDYSFDSVNWTTALSYNRTYPGTNPAPLTVTSIGPYIGNSVLAPAVSAPAFNGLIDYFFNTASPIAKEDEMKYNLSGFKLNYSDGSGIPGWNITLTNGINQITRLTDGTGFYEFTDLSEGTYTVSEEMRAGWMNVSAASREINILGKDEQVNFTNQPIVPTYNVSGFKISADNGSGISGWNITLAEGSIQKSTLTNNNGSYYFTGVINGTYTVTEEIRPGWKNITNASRQVIVLGQDVQDINFTNKPLFIVSDDFSAPTLNTSLWTKIDRLGDSNFTIEGTGTSDALLNITIPAGNKHDPFSTAQNNDAPRIMQSVVNTDFEVMAKFQSVINKDIQMQGILVEQDKKNYTRFEFYSYGNKIYVYKADIINGALRNGIIIPTINVSDSPMPMYMKVKRAGNQWTQDYSFDNVNWTTAVSYTRTYLSTPAPLTVTSVGPYIGTSVISGSVPAFNGLIDYFFNASSPIAYEDLVISNISGFNIDDNNSNGKWDAGESGIPNWKISLLNANTDAEITNTTTDLTGHYAFNNLLPGIYKVKEETKTDYTATNSTSVVVTVSGKNINNLNFTNYLPRIPPTITLQPGNFTVKLGKTAKFTVSAEGSNNLSYQWQRNGVNISGSSGKVQNYSITTTYMVNNEETYRVLVMNPYGSIISNTSRVTVLNIISDDFNALALNTSTWTKIDPIGDAKLTMEGTGTQNALLNITVPAGVSHDVWRAAGVLTGGNNGSRIMQTANNSDFEIQTKFQSNMTQAYQMQGIIIQQDNDNYLRFDFVKYPTVLNVYAASFTAGFSPAQKYIAPITPGSPLYMKIKRTGDNWKQFYSTDGTNWTAAADFNHTLIVSMVGPFVGNAPYSGNVPAFTGMVDYFFNISSPSVPEDELDIIPPNITVWYGKSQRFGQNDVPQKWVNILGNVNDPSGVAFLNYSLNNGSASPLSMGPDALRLQSAGDFNVEIDHSSLRCGDNQLVIRAADKVGNSKNETVSINYSCNKVIPKNYSINWNNVTNITDAAQITDGLWIKEANSIRSANIGYDRMITIGNMTWDDYEITAPFTLNAPLNSASPSGGPNFGFGMRWQGHYDSVPPVQPRYIWDPLGALGLYIWNNTARDFQLSLIGNGMKVLDHDTSGRHLSVGTTYIFKMRAETIVSNTLYSLKVWEQGTTEPLGWTISGYGPATELKHGSITVTSHYADVSIGNISIKPGPFPDPTPPVISNVTVDTLANSATVHWITNKVTTSNLSYGLTTAYENGTIFDGTKLLVHSITLNNLTQGTLYHYKVKSTDNGGNSTNTSDLNFTTKKVTSVISDDFHAPTLNTSIWTKIDPKGDATFSIEGNDTVNALLNITLPAGIPHNVWRTNGTGGNDAARIMQFVSNDDFEIQTKFQSQMTQAFQMQGIIIEQDNDNYLRFDFVQYPGTLYVYAASFTGGSIPVARSGIVITPGSPLYMKVNRTGNNWKQSYSYDGTNWIPAANFNHTLTVTSVGPFVGNTGDPVTTSPAFTGLFDYFFNTKSPIVPEDPVPPTPPTITVQPGNKTAINGSGTTFDVVAAGSEPLSYQWKKNNVNITNATGPSYTTPAVNPSDAGTKFSVLVWNAYGNVTSNQATLSVIEPIDIPWWNTSRSFRVPITVNAASFERYEKPVEISLDFTRMLSDLGQAGTLAENSIRIVETDSQGAVLNDEVQFQFDKDTGFNAATKASGIVVFIMNGTTQANQTRYYQVYFGLTGVSYSPLTVTPQLTLADNVMDEGQTSYQIGAAGSTYYFQKEAGGFSSLVDASNNDWINFHPLPALSAGGAYRGIPNVYEGGIFHPGHKNATSSIVSQGPLKIRVKAVSTNGKWESFWDFYPGYATMTMTKAGASYWWLYEGTPGGLLEINKDFMVRSDNKKTLLSETTLDDIPTQEWAYFSDPTVNRSLFVSHHEDDTSVDEYWPMQGLMTVFGFARSNNPLTGLLTTVPEHFTMGLMDGTEFAQSSKTVYSAYKDMRITKGAAEQYDNANPPVIITQPVNSYVLNGSQARFNVSVVGQLPISYQWKRNGVNISGATSASYTIPSANMSDNGSIFTVVVSNAIDSVTSNPAKLTVGTQVVLLDVTYTHNTVSRAFSFFDIPSGVPSNLVSPINYAQGTLYQRVEVLSKPSNKGVKYKLCIFQDEIIPERHSCAQGSGLLNFAGTGTYYSSMLMTSLYQYSNNQWNRSLLANMLVVNDANDKPVDDRYGWLGTWIGSPDFSLYYPMKVHYTAIVVPPGGGEPVWTPLISPVITTQPANSNMLIGQTATFSVVAAGTAPLYYQWQKNGVNISGAHSSSYTTPSLTMADTGSKYSVIVTNEMGSVTSNNAELTVSPTINIVKNPGFESGTTPWLVYPTSSVAFSRISPGSEGTYAAKLSLSSAPLGTQLYQTGLTLEPNTRYRLSFSAYSTTGHDLRVRLNKTLSPYTSYGLESLVNISTGWQDYSVEFDTTIAGKVTDACLQFYLYPYAKAGDIYYIDNVKLGNVVDTPEITGKSPTGTNVPVTARITLNFSEAMDNASVESAFSTSPNMTGSFSWSGNNMTFTPDSNLAYSTTYNVTVGTGARNLATITMSAPYEWNFTTMDQDLIPPTVVVNSNSPTGTDVYIGSVINVTFSEAMNQSSVQSAFQIDPSITGTISWNGNTMTFTPLLDLAYNRTYNITVGTGAMDMAGNNMATPYKWNFTTMVPDLTAPEVIGNSPTGTNVSVAARIIVNFSEAMNQSSVLSAFQTVPSITGTISWNGNNMTYTPVSNLLYNTAYNVTIGTGAKDLSGNNLNNSSEWQFITVPDTTAPEIIGNAPKGSNNPVTSRITVNFSEAMNHTSVESVFSTSPNMTGSFSWSGNNMTYIPGSTLSFGTLYSVTIGTGARDLAGNMLSPLSWHFTTSVPSENLITNPGFESGKTPWLVYPTTSIAFSTVSPGSEGTYSAKLSFSSVPLGIQLYQPNINKTQPLEPNTRYRLSFAAYSTTGHDVSVKLKKTLTPFTSYGLDSVIDLGTTWQNYSVEFNTTITSSVTDACLQFYLYPYAKVGDIYYIDNVRLEKVIETSPIPPEVIGNTPTGTNVPVTASISVNFSKPMNHASAEAAFSTLPSSTGNFTWSGNNMTYTPTLNFSFNTIYNVTIGTGAMDSTGNTLVSSYNWQFTTIPDTSAPIVIEKTPTGNNEPVTTKITVTFSEAMNQASAESAFSTIPVTTGSFSWSGNVMTYTPGLNLGSNTTYIVTVGSGARDLAGNSLNVTYIWPFITGALDATPPTITGNTPTGNNEPVTSRITVTFSEAMNQTSVESAFSTSPGIAGSFSWSGNNMTYIPGSTLSFGTTYSVTIASGAKDLAGNMLSPLTWNFKTSVPSENLITNPGFESGKTPWLVYPTTSITYNTVSPGSEGNYSAKLSFSSVPLGIQLYQPNIGTLEPNTRYRLTFSAYSTTGHDVSVKLKKTHSPYTPYGLDSVINLGTTWQDYSVEFNTTITGNVTDACLQFYLYPYAQVGDIYYIDNVRLGKAIDVPPIPPEVIGNAPTGTNVQVTAIISVNFSKPMNHTSVESAFSTLPSSTGNFTWSGNNMIYTPTLNFSFNTTYNVTIGTGAMDSTGNTLVSSYNWQFTTIPDTSAPIVIGKTPTGNNEPVTTKITVTFNEAMNNSSVESAFSTIPVTTGSFSWSGNVMTYTPDSNLAYNQTYNVTVGTGAKDLAGNSLNSAYIWSFITFAPDAIPPTINGNTPTGNNEPVTTKITVTFSEAMNHISVESAFSTSPSIAGSFSWSGNNMTYIPGSNLAYSQTYNVTVGTDAMDIAGNHMSAQYEWNFTTMDPDVTPPIIIGNSPAGTNVSVAAQIIVNFSEPMNQESVQSSFFTITATTGSFSWNGNNMTYTPLSNLEYGKTYNVIIGPGAKDIAGNNLSELYVWDFTTVPYTMAPDTTAPEIIGNTPRGSNNPVTSRIIVTFSEAMNHTSVESVFSTSPNITGSFSWSGNNMTYTPDSVLNFSTTYNVTIGTGATDLAGNMLSPLSWSFTTASSSINLITNPGFESGKTPWMVYPTTSIAFSTVSPGSEGTYSAKLGFSSVPLGIQLYQPNIKNLEPNSRYRLSFAAYSTTGHDVSVKLKKTLSPYTSYGLDSVIDLGTAWQDYSVEFNTTITSTVNDGCLQFYLYPFAVQTDIYYIDNVVLEKIS